MTGSASPTRAKLLWSLSKRRTPTCGLLLLPQQPEAVVDLNYLFHRQQVERTRSEEAESDEARTAHEELARRYEEQIEELTADEFHFPKEG